MQNNRADSNGWAPRPAHSKTLVLCLDGTGDQFDDTNTNIVKIFGALEKEKPEKQLVYYQTGVGTGVSESVLTPITSWVSKQADSAVGWYLDAHIIGAYKFIQQHWDTGDRICIFGFSRGAYTSRALAGFLHAVGVLPRSMPEQVDFAYKIWKAGNPSDCTYYKTTMSRDCDIDFLGVFDTVASVGAVIPRALPFSTHNGKTRVFRHAIALDEHRAKFRQETWHYSLPKKPFSYYDVLSAPYTWFRRHMVEGLVDGKHTEKELKDTAFKTAMEALDKDSEDRKANIKEVWFAGDHCDVGGGHYSDFEEHSVSYIPLRWMIKEAVEAGTNIIWKADKLDKYGIKIPTIPTAALNDEQTAALYYGAAAKDVALTSDKTALKELLAEKRAGDVKQKLSDNLLKFKPIWWLLEFSLLVERKQTNDYSWVLKPHINFFGRRDIPHIEAEHLSNPHFQDELAEHHPDGQDTDHAQFDVFVHASVQERINLLDEQYFQRSFSNSFTKSPYHPLALTNKFHPIWVE